jgi:hypothetical protein
VKSPAAGATGIRTLAIPALQNRTTSFQVEQRLTRALIEEFSRRSPYKITSQESGADAVLRGDVIGVGALPVIIGNESVGNTFLVTLVTNVKLVDLKTNKTLFRKDAFVFHEEYVINFNVKQFFSEQNPAVDRMAQDFARSVAATVLAGN